MQFYFFKLPVLIVTPTANDPGSLKKDFWFSFNNTQGDNNRSPCSAGRNNNLEKQQPLMSVAHQGDKNTAG